MIKIKRILKEDMTRQLAELIYLKLNDNLNYSRYLINVNIPKSIYLKIVFNKNTDVNITDDFGNTALIWASRKNKVLIVKILLSHPKIDVNVQGLFNNTALMNACDHNNILVVKLLLAHPDIDVNLLDTIGETAIDYSESELIDKLIKNHPGYKGKK